MRSLPAGGCGQFIDDSGLLSLMALVLIGYAILTNRTAGMNNEIPIEVLPECVSLHSFY